MRTILKVVLATGMTLVLGLIGCNSCKDNVLNNVTSPDGQWTATIIARDCGATTTEYVGVSVHHSRDANIDPKAYVFVVKRLQPIEVFWQGINKLEINCRCPNADVKKKLSSLGSIDILYSSK